MFPSGPRVSPELPLPLQFPAVVHARVVDRARVEVVVRHLDLEADRERRLLTRDGNPIALTSAQFDLLCLFMEHPGRVYTRGEILRDVFDTQFEGYQRTVDVHIKNIRKALESDQANPRYIQTVWGVGYRMAEGTQ